MANPSLPSDANSAVYASELLSALIDRESLIADHAWRDRDSDGHLAALVAVSERIVVIGSRWASDPEAKLPGRVRHFLDGCSYQKARHWLESAGVVHAGGNVQA